MVVSRTGMYKDRFAAGRPLPTTRSEKHGAITGRSVASHGMAPRAEYAADAPRTLMWIAIRLPFGKRNCQC